MPEADRDADDVLFVAHRVRGWLRHLHEWEDENRRVPIPKKTRKPLAKEVAKLRRLADRLEKAIEG